MNAVSQKNTKRKTAGQIKDVYKRTKGEGGLMESQYWSSQWI